MPDRTRTRTLNIPPSQNDQPNTSFSAHARLAFFFPSTLFQCSSSATRLSLYVWPLLASSVFIVRIARVFHIRRLTVEGRISPLSNLAFHSAAMLMRRVHATSSFSANGPTSRDTSSLYRSGAWMVRWYPKTMNSVTHENVMQERIEAVANGVVCTGGYISGKTVPQCMNPPLRHQAIVEGERAGPLVTCVSSGSDTNSYRASTERAHTIIARICADILHVDFRSRAGHSIVACLCPAAQVFPMLFQRYRWALMTGWCLGWERYGFWVEMW